MDKEGGEKDSKLKLTPKQAVIIKKENIYSGGKSGNTAVFKKKHQKFWDVRSKILKKIKEEKVNDNTKVSTILEIVGKNPFSKTSNKDINRTQ